MRSQEYQVAERSEAPIMRRTLAAGFADVGQAFQSEATKGIFLQRGNNLGEHTNMIHAGADDYIAGSKTSKDWHAARERLVNGTEAEWRVAVEEFFIQRLELRYLNPIRILQQNGSFSGEGFSIVAIQCSLVEFLESIYQGKNYRWLRKGDRPGPYEYSLSGEMFVAFLRDRQPFSLIFNEVTATDFYEGVRCGLLHEARTKNGWRIWATASRPDVIADISSKILYRDGFQLGLLDFVARYRSLVPSNPELRRAFIRKYDSLAN